MSLAELFFLKNPRRLHWGKRRHQKRARERRKFQLEPLEQRLLLSVDFMPEAAAAMVDGLGQLGERVDGFLTGEGLLQERVPVLLSVQENEEGLVVDRAPTISDLFTVPVDANGDEFIDHPVLLSDDDEAVLDDLDTDDDSQVDVGEFLQGWFFEPVQDFLDGTTPFGPPATTGEFAEFLDGIFSIFIFDLSLNQSLTNLSGLFNVSFTMVDIGNPGFDTTEDPDAEVTFDAGFELVITQDLPIDLGLEADSLKLLPFTGPADAPEPPTVEVTSTLTFGFTFGVFTGGQDPATEIDANDFFVRSAEPLLVGVTSSETNLDFKLNVGFLGAEVVNGSLDLQADVVTTLLDPDDPEVLGFGDGQHGVEQTGGVVTADNPIPNSDLDHEAGFFLRIGNLGVSTAVTVADNARGDNTALLGDVEDALPAELAGLITASLTGDDRLRFSLVDTTSNPLGFANETQGDGIMGMLVATPNGDGDTIYEFTTDVVFLLSVGGALPRLVTVRFPDPSKKDMGFDSNQDADLVDDLIGQNDAVANGQLSGNASFFLKVTQDNGTSTTSFITVPQSATDGTDAGEPVANTSRSDLAEDIDDELASAGLGGLIDAQVSGTKIALAAKTDAVSAIEIVFADAETQNEIGLVTGQKVTLKLTAANNAVSSGDLSGTATFDVTVTTVGSGTATTRVTVAADETNNNVADLAADVDAALASEGLAIDAVAVGSKIVLVAQSSNVAAFDVTTVNQTIDDLVDDVNVALNHAGLGGQVSASPDGMNLKLSSTGGESLEITNTLTFDAGVTFEELESAADVDLFSQSTGGASNTSFTLPVEVLAGLEDPGTGMDWDPQDVAIVGNFDPFGPLAMFDDVEQRFNLDLTVDPPLPSDPPIAVPDATTLMNTIKLVNFAELLQFNVVSAESMVGLLTQLGQALESLANSGQYSLYGIPFSAADLSDMLVFGDLIQTELIYDFGADGELNEDASITNNNDSELTDEGEESRLMIRSVVPADGQDTVELLPSFFTAQELAERLGTILGVPLGPDGINATYNPADDPSPTGNELSYTVSLRSKDRISVGVDEDFEKPFEFDVDLTPFHELTVDTVDDLGMPLDAKVTLKGRTSLDMTFGVDLDFAAPIDFSPGPGGTELADLNNESGIGIKLERAITGEGLVRNVFGLGSDAAFLIKIDGNAPVRVELSKDAIDEANETLLPDASDMDKLNLFATKVEEAINDALSGATVDVDIAPDAPSLPDNRLQITLTSGGATIDLIPVSDDPSALIELGFDPDAAAAATVVARSSAPRLFGLTETAGFTVNVSASSLGVLSGVIGGDVAIEVSREATAANRSIAELAADVNNALRAAGLLVLNGGVEEGVRAGFDAGRLVLTATDTTTHFSVTVNGGTAQGTIAHEELGLALNTKGANQYDFIIVDRDGMEHAVSLDAVAGDGPKVADLIDLLNGVAPGVVHAGPNATGTGLRLTDISPNPDDPAPDVRDPIGVATVNGSLAALKLGLLTNPANPDDIDNPDKDKPTRDPDFVEGSPIGTRALPDRFFVRDGEMGGALTMELPSGGIAGDALVGFVGVEVTMTGGLGAEISADLQGPGGAPGTKVTLAELQGGVGESDPAKQVMTDPLVSKLQTLNYDTEFVGFTPGRSIVGATSGATAVILEVVDNGTDGTLRLFNIEGAFQDDEVIVDGEFPTDPFKGAALANGTVSQETYFGEFDLGFAVKDGLDDASDVGFGPGIEAALDGLTGTVPVKLTGFGDANADPDPIDPVVDLVDLAANLGALHDFVDLGYADLLAALEELETLVLTLEDQFALLDQALPLVNTSVGELLSISDAFSLSVNNFQEVVDEALELLDPSEEDVPALTLQGMALALRGAFGLADDSTGVLLDVTSDGLLTVELDLVETISTTLGLDVDLSDGGLPNLTSGKILQVSGELALGFKIGIDLANPQDVYLFNPDGGLSGNLFVDGNGAEDLGLVFQAMVGDVPVLVRDGFVDMDLEFSLGGLDFGPDGRELLSNVGFGDFTTDVPVQSFVASIPLFDPTGGLTGFIGEITADGDLGGLSLPDLDDLADTVADIASAIADFNPLDNLSLLSDNVDFFLENLQGFFDLELFNVQLPIVGSNFAEGARFIEEFRTPLVNDLRTTIEAATDIQVSDITDLIEGFFADAGINVSNLSVLSDLTNASVTERFAQWNFTLDDTVTVPFDLDFDIGVPLLGMDVDIPLDIDIGWTMDWGIGVSFQEGSFIDVGDPAELSIMVDIDLPAAETFSGTLGFLQLIVENLGSGVHLEFAADLTNEGGGSRLGFSDLGSLGFTPSLLGHAVHDKVLDLAMSVGITGVATVFPNLSTNFVLDWNLPQTPLASLSGDALAAGLDLIELSDIKLDAGSFLKDFLGETLGEVTKFTEPLDDIIETLTAPIPIVSDLAGKDVTLLDLAGVFGEVNTEFIDWIETVLNVIDIIGDIGDATTLGIDIGSLTLFDAAGGGAIADVDKMMLFDPDLVLADVVSLSNATPGLTLFDFDDKLDQADPSAGSGDAQAAKNALKSLRDGNLQDLLEFPFLDDPLEIVGLFLGDVATLIEVNAPPLEVAFDYTQVFPIFGPLAGSVGLGFLVGIDLSFGFDTFGVKRFADGGFTNPALIFDGFFLGDRENVTMGADIPEVFFEFNLTVAAELSLAIARAGVGLQGTAFIGFNLFDPDGDGAVHLSELANTIENQLRSDKPGLAPLSIFDLEGGLILELLAFLIIDFGIFEVEYEFPITPEITVLDFGFSFERPPILATDLKTGTLQLNMGPNALDRLNGDTRDGSEEFHVRKTSDGIEVWSPVLGISEGSAQEYTGDFTHIVGLGGQGDDTIILYGFDESTITAEFDGGVGNDTIKFMEDAAVASPATGAGAVIRGGEGNDTLVGGHLDDIILGGEGNDVVEGGRGYDVLFGDDGVLGVLPGGVQFVGKRISVKDGDDVLYGGSSSNMDLADADLDDILIGGGGEDELHGDAGSDVVLGDGGRLLYGLTDEHIDVSSIRPDPFVPNDKFDPTPAVSTSQKIENIFVQLSGHFSGTDLGPGANDMIFGGDDDDFLFGGAADDTIMGGDGNDYAVGGLGFDTIGGGEGNDTLFGNAQNDVIDGNEDMDVISGGFGDDVIHGNTGNDYMKGGRGLDVMYGDEDDDEVLGEGEPDVLFGGIGNDLVIGGVGADIMFGDDGIVAKLDPDDMMPFGDVSVGIGNPMLITAAMRAAADDIPGSLDLIITDPVALDGDDILSGDAAGDIVLGGGGDDIIGGDVDPRLAVANTPEETTESGRDVLIGDGGIVQFDERRLQRIASMVDDDPTSFRDTIYGDNANDVIIGGQGSDSGETDFLGEFPLTRVLAGGHGPGRGDTDPEVTDDDIIIGDNGELLFADDTVPENFGRLELIRTTDTTEATGGADTAFGELGDDAILGGVNGSNDVLHGSLGNDVILGDNGELDFAFDGDTNLDTLDLIRSYRDGLGGTDEISGSAGDDVLIGGTGGDLMYGDDATASNEDDDGEDIMLGDNADIFLIGNVGRLMVRVADMPEGTAVDLIRTTDDSESTGGADTMSGNAKADIMLGGVNNDDGMGDAEVDTMYGDRAAPTETTIGNDADDIMLGDNGLLDFTFDGDMDRNTLDLIRSFEDGLGGTDVMSGNKGQDVAIGGTGDDAIYGDDLGATAEDADLGDLLLGDNADVFLVAANGAMGGDTKLVLDAAVFLIRTTDEEHPEYGGVDTISGNADGDIIAGGVEGDTLYGDAVSVVPELDGDDVILGDNGAFEWLSTGRLSEILGIDIEENNPALFAKYDPGVPDDDLTTLDLITTEQPTSGGRDTIYGDEGSDLAFGGTDLDWIHGDDGNEAAEVMGSLNRDVLFGDHGRLYPQFSVRPAINSRNFFAIDTGDSDGGEGDLMWGEEGDDVMLGQQGDDRMWGGTEDDDMIGGHNVSGGHDELSLPAVQAELNPPMNDLMDGGSGDDAMAGDNTIVWRRGDDLSPRFRMLTEGAIYTTGPDQVDTMVTNVDAAPQSDPDDAVGRDIELVDHADGTAAGLFGADVMAGGADSDVMFGQLGDDLMQGDGDIGADDMNPDFVTRLIEVTDSGMPDTTEDLYFNVPEQATDADDYMEGNGGDDLMYGGLGQDDIIGGSSGLFGLTTEDERPDGSDIIFGGAGAPARLVRNDFVGFTDTDTGTAVGVGAVPTDDDPSIALEDRHSRDADFIMGDNANVYRLVGPGDLFLEYNFDQDSEFEDRGDERIVVRAMEQLDYTLGGSDYAGGIYVNGAAQPNGQPADNGAGDLIHGESGDDYIFGMTGSDVIFGESDDDDLVGGYGNDWISGGTGQDGVLGDDGLLYTSRNSEEGEPLYGIAGLLANDPSSKYNNGTALDETISTPGDIQYAVINVEGELKKTADLVPFSFDPGWLGLDDEFPDDASNTPYADDIIFGGLGGDFLHGGSGDDAISGAEALEHAYVPTFDGNGDPDGVLDLGYDAFDLPDPINPGDAVANPNPGDVLAFNPVDLDGQHLNNRFRAGEFFLYDEYDPRTKILLNASGELWKPGDAGVPVEFLLNFDETEGIWRDEGDVPKATGQQTEHYPEANEDGKDAIFGDLGNDWIVGGTGRDNLYGGWGNDLLNADDVLGTNGDLNDMPDTHPYYEDRAYGGAGRDILIGNTGGDRLIDWVGEYNSFLVPYAPFGQASVSRTMMPHLHEFLYALSAGDGADFTRFADAIGGEEPEPTNNNPIPSRNGEPYGEMGMVLQQDFAWNDQTGAPADPQAGNIPGGPRDVLRSAGFQDGSMEGFFVDTGKFSVENGVLQVAADSPQGDAISVYHVGDALPGYFEVQASISVVKPTAGWKANAYVIFDYVDQDDFKFAGIDDSINKLVVGHRTASGWQVDKQMPFQVKPDTTYNMLIAVNGVNVTVVVNNQASVSYSFAPRMADGFSYGLNYGLIGVGSDSSRGTYDNIVVQVLPPQITYETSEDFAGGAPPLFPAAAQAGAWAIQPASGRYTGTPPAGATAATALMDLGVNGLYLDSLLDLSATVSTETRAGFVFDRYSDEDFKFVAIDAGADQVIIGHRSAKGGWATDLAIDATIDSGADYTLDVVLKGAGVSVKLDGQMIGGHVYNAVTVDGDFGLLAMDGPAEFDDVTVKTDDAGFVASEEENLIAASSSSASGSGLAVAQSDLDSIATVAVTRWIDALGDGDPRLASLGGVRFAVADLEGDVLGYRENGTILVDVDGAGHGWFVDPTPGDDREFTVHLGGDGLAAAPGSDAYGHIDLLTVVSHEVGHLVGFEDLDPNGSGAGLMSPTLEPGLRYLPSDDAPSSRPAGRPGSSSGAAPSVNVPGGFVPIAASHTSSVTGESRGVLVDWTPRATAAFSSKGSDATEPGGYNAKSWLLDFLTGRSREEAEQDRQGALEGLDLVVEMEAEEDESLLPSV